jgi:hypothetical protein
VTDWHKHSKNNNNNKGPSGPFVFEWWEQSPHLNSVMRAHEFLTERDHEADARDALITLLTTNHALGINTIGVDQISRSLEDNNFFVDTDWIVNNSKQAAVVDADASTSSEIVLKTDGASEQPDTQDAQPDLPDQQSTVASMAKSALNKRI